MSDKPPIAEDFIKEVEETHYLVDTTNMSQKEIKLQLIISEGLKNDPLFLHKYTVEVGETITISDRPSAKGVWWHYSHGYEDRAVAVADNRMVVVEDQDVQLYLWNSNEWIKTEQYTIGEHFISTFLAEVDTETAADRMTKFLSEMFTEYEYLDFLPMGRLTSTKRKPKHPFEDLEIANNLAVETFFMCKDPQDFVEETSKIGSFKFECHG